MAWLEADKATAGLQSLNLRLASDSRGEMCSKYGVLKTTNKEHIPFRYRKKYMPDTVPVLKCFIWN
jgi:alkyl hydroperoxide reductase subunit AhpC